MMGAGPLPRGLGQRHDLREPPRRSVKRFSKAAMTQEPGGSSLTAPSRACKRRGLAQRRELAGAHGDRPPPLHRDRPEPPPVLRPALPHDLHPAADGLHLLPTHGHPLPAAPQPAGPAQRSRVAGLRPGQPAARTGECGRAPRPCSGASAVACAPHGPVRSGAAAPGRRWPGVAPSVQWPEPLRFGSRERGGDGRSW